MPDRIPNFLGKKFVCPACESKLKFLRPSTKQLLTCPNCRRKLRLQEKTAAASEDERIQEAIESLIDWQTPEAPPAYDYQKDPQLDRVDSSSPGVWKFDQPWPENVHQVVFERVDVQCIPTDVEGTFQSRRMLLDGSFRRVTVHRTGEVEEMAVTGHWWDFEPHEAKLGILSRSVVRDLNRILTAKRFASRINCMQETIRQSKQFLELFIDLAIDETPPEKSIIGDRVW